MEFRDVLTLDAGGRRKTANGSLMVTGRAARTGIQEYAGYEVGKPELDRVKVYRPPGEVFSDDSMRSFAFKPVTNDHPNELVTSITWKRDSVGMIGDAVARDGETIVVPFVIQDQAAIDIVESGKVELSAGYTCDLKWEEGTTADGLNYDAIQTNIRANHLAIVDQARGGPTLRIGDSDTMEKTHSFLYDGLPILVTDQAEAAIKALQGKLSVADAKVAELTTAAGAAAAKTTTDLATRDAEIADLKAKLAAAQLTPAQLDQMVADKAAIVLKAKALAPALVTDGKTFDQIRREAIIAKHGEAAVKDKDDTYVAAYFDAMTKDVQVGKPPAPHDPIRDHFQQNGALPVVDAAAAEKAWRDSVTEESNAWQGTKQ